MRVARGYGRIALVLGGLAVAACGGGGVSLEAWAEEADPICDDLADALADAEDAEEIEAELDDAADALEELEAPGNDDDAEIVANGIDGLREAVGESVDLLAAVDEGDDALAALADAAAGPDVDDAVEQIEETGAGGCVDAAEDGAGPLDQLAVSAELLGEVADLRVGDCVVLDPDLALAPSCDDAEGEILRTSLGEPECPEEADVTETVERSEGDDSVIAGLCLRTLVNPDDTDGFLEIGSCAEVQRREDGSFDVVELECDDPAVTHQISSGIAAEGSCALVEQSFATSEEEKEAFGFEFWCATPA